MPKILQKCNNGLSFNRLYGIIVYMIQSFGNRLTEDLYNGVASKETRRFPVSLHRMALKKLTQIQVAGALTDIGVYPGNRLEKKQGDLDGYWGIRINDQWRVIFKWDGKDAHDVTIIDYH